MGKWEKVEISAVLCCMPMASGNLLGPWWQLGAVGEMAGHKGPTRQGKGSQLVEHSTHACRGTCGVAGLRHPVLSP